MTRTTDIPELRTDLPNLQVKQLVARQKRANTFFKKGGVFFPFKHRGFALSSFAVRNPQEAALDSKVLLQNSEMGAAMARAMKHDAGAFDVDDYLTKLLVFLEGANAGVAEDEFDGREEDVSLNWGRIGTKVLKHSRRAVCMDFMWVNLRRFTSPNGTLCLLQGRTSFTRGQAKKANGQTSTSREEPGGRNSAARGQFSNCHSLSKLTPFVACSCRYTTLRKRNYQDGCSSTAFLVHGCSYPYSF